MTRWNPKEIESIIGSEFSLPEQSDWREASFELGGIRYCLTVCAEREFVCLRADASNPNQATPQFEFCFRCDRIRVGEGGYNSRAVRFDYSNGEEEIDYVRHTRLVIDRLPDGNFYVWPMIGAQDPPLEIADSGEQNVAANP